MGAERAPVHSPTRAPGLTEGREREYDENKVSCGLSMLTGVDTRTEAKQRQEEDDEEEQLRQLQAELAM
jgi:hypothetical protein